MMRTKSDASREGLCAAVEQLHRQGWKLYHSHHDSYLTAKRCTVSLNKLLVVWFIEQWSILAIRCIKHFKQYVYGNKSKFLTDQYALCCLMETYKAKKRTKACSLDDSTVKFLTILKLRTFWWHLWKNNGFGRVICRATCSLVNFIVTIPENFCTYLDKQSRSNYGNKRKQEKK